MLTSSDKWLPVALIGLGVALVIVAIAFPLTIKSETIPASAPIPTQIAEYSLSSVATGRAALQEFAQLHGKSFPVVAGAKAIYGSENQVVIWAAGTASVADTRKLLEEMRDKIAQGAANSRSPFQPAGVRSINNREVYALDGMGQKHFYFQSGTYLIWLAANAEVADQALQQALNFYP